MGELLAEHLPEVACTLSHQLNPTLREYRRASSTCIDASLKPLMRGYLHGLKRRLREAGFAGRVLMVTSQGGMMDADDVAEAPIHAIGSGPAMAPVAGRHYAALDAATDTAVVADTGGTSYDVSLVRQGRIPWTRETWLGQRFRGHMTGFPSVDVKSIGAGGGSIGWVDAGGLLHCGPQSAGSKPGPACYGTGGVEPTVTDCALLLGYIDPAFFLGGAMRLDLDAARHALASRVASPLGLGLEEAAAAVLALATEKMVGAIEEITINQGIDPRSAVLIGGGGAAGPQCGRGRAPARLPRGRDPGGRRGVERRRRADVGSQRRVQQDGVRDQRPLRCRRDQRRAGGPRAAVPRVHRGPRRGLAGAAHRLHRRGALPAPDLGDRGADGGRVASAAPRTCARSWRASTRPTSRSSRSAIRSPRSSS